MKKNMLSFVLGLTVIVGLPAMAMPDGGWYYGVCKAHDWRGHSRNSSVEAWKDAYAHKDLYPDKTHKLNIERSDR